MYNINLFSFNSCNVECVSQIAQICKSPATPAASGQAGSFPKGTPHPIFPPKRAELPFRGRGLPASKQAGYVEVNGKN